jgi:endonuclease/exonuclease/phosphatase (EEP) superfamily protein YafD
LRLWAAYLILILLALTVAASFLPLIETNAWWVRYFDFPRLPLVLVLLVLLAATAVARAGLAGWVVGLLAVLALGYHGSKLYPYSQLPKPMALDAPSCAPDSALSIMIANVQERNEQPDPFMALVADIQPDILLIMETDAWWDRELASLREDFADVSQFIPEEDGAFGMHLFSKLPLVSPEFLFFFDAFTPTVLTDIELRNGEVVRFVGVHPHPPLAWSQPTTLRDGSLLTAGFLARSANYGAIVAGDFNAVPWEPVTERAMRIGELLDPRIGRGYYPTFSSKSVYMSWPLDQILFQPELRLISFETLPDIGSDHYPVVARLCHLPEQASSQPAPQLRHDDLEEAQTSIEAAKEMNPRNRK